MNNPTLPAKPEEIARYEAVIAELQSVNAALMALIAAAPVKHLDETGFRVGGRTWCLHIAGTLRLPVYRAAQRRGSIPQMVSGIVVHDHRKPYYQLKGVLHALCNAHHLRELKPLIEIERENGACQMQRLLRRFFKKERPPSTAPPAAAAAARSAGAARW